MERRLALWCCSSLTENIPSCRYTDLSCQGLCYQFYAEWIKLNSNWVLLQGCSETKPLHTAVFWKFWKGKSFCFVILASFIILLKCLMIVNWDCFKFHFLGCVMSYLTCLLVSLTLSMLIAWSLLCYRVTSLI